MKANNKKKADQLGMSIGTASNRLRKKLLFFLVQETNRDTCYHCDQKIEDIDNLSIEHKIPWLDSENPIELFFDLDNIAFSHLSCNVGAGRRHKGPRAGHGSPSMYINHGCRCELCTKSASKRAIEWRNNKR